MLSGKIVSRVLFISCIHSQCIQIPWIAKDGGIVSHFHVASAQIQCIFNWILCVCYKQTPAPHLIKVSEVMTQKRERKKEILLFWVLKLRKRFLTKLELIHSCWVMMRSCRLESQEGKFWRLMWGVHCSAAPVALIKRRKVATKSNFGGKDDVNKILTEPFFGTCVLPDGKSRGLGLNVFRMT